jgi:hypothetical protein
MFEGLRKPEELIVIVVTLLAYGCPPQAIVHALHLDERTVARWQERAGAHCQKVHSDQVVQAKLDLQHVQADEIRGKGCQMIPWMAMAMMVSTRLWLGGVVSLSRDRKLADQLLQMVKACCLPLRAVLVLTDGWSAYPGSIRRAFREKVKRTGKRGRCALQAWPDLLIGTEIRENSQKARGGSDPAHGTRKLGAGERPVGADEGRKGIEHRVYRTLQWNHERAPGQPDKAVSACSSTCRQAQNWDVACWVYLQFVLAPP